MCREFSSLSGLPAGLSTALRYNPCTAAVEKIPLSVVQVNNKPQYLVFCSHSRHPTPKPAAFACGKRKRPCRARVRQAGFAPNPVQSETCAPTPPRISSLVPALAPYKTQDRCSWRVRLWRCGEPGSAIPARPVPVPARLFPRQIKGGMERMAGRVPAPHRPNCGLDGTIR